MKVIFLGTNGWYDNDNGNTVCVLVETKERYSIFDAGNGIYKIDKYITKNKPVCLFLSHYHLDHVIGLHILNKFNFKQGLDVYGPPGLKLLFKRVINKPYSMPLNRLNLKVRLHEIKGFKGLPAGVTCKPLKHSVVCYGYRVCSQGKVVAYCTDTGLCENLYALARNAELLIAECSYKSGQSDASWPHLNPQQAASVAKSVSAKKLILVHFDAANYPTAKDIKSAGKAGRKIFKNTLAVRDGFCYNL